MHRILNREDFASMLSREQAILYFFVGWSAYAVQGLHILEEVESILSLAEDGSAQSFWLADVSDVHATAAFIGKWLKGQERVDLKMYNVVATGSGSVAWLKRGKVVDFVLSAAHHKARTLAERTKNAFGETAT